MGTLGTNGYTIKTFAEIKALVQTAFQTAWPNINLDEQSPQGIWINWLSEWLSNNDLDGLNVFNNMNLNNATGSMLTFIAILRGTERNDGTKALIDVTLTSTSYPYTIPVNTEFALSGSDTLFENTVAITVSSASQTAQLQAKVNGLSGANIGDKLSSVGTISALTDIEITTITDGIDDESDEALRSRLRGQNSLTSTGEVDDIYSALINLDNTIKAVVYENDTGVTDSLSIPSKHINAVVLGSTDQEIIDVIALKKSGGTPTYGASSGTYTDTQGYNHPISFDRPSKKDIYIAASVTAKPGQNTVDSSYNTVIRTKCKDFINELKIGQDISYTSVYGFFATPAVNSAGVPVSPFDIVGLTMSKASSTTGMVSTNIAIDPRDYSWIEDETNQITITVL